VSTGNQPLYKIASDWVIVSCSTTQHSGKDACTDTTKLTLHTVNTMKTVLLPQEFMEASNPLSEDNEEDEDGSLQGQHIYFNLRRHY
jgi:hypothetical protein